MISSVWSDSNMSIADKKLRKKGYAPPPLQTTLAGDHDNPGMRDGPDSLNFPSFLNTLSF